MRGHCKFLKQSYIALLYTGWHHWEIYLTLSHFENGCDVTVYFMPEFMRRLLSVCEKIGAIVQKGTVEMLAHV